MCVWVILLTMTAAHGTREAMQIILQTSFLELDFFAALITDGLWAGDWRILGIAEHMHAWLLSFGVDRGLGVTARRLESLHILLHNHHFFRLGFVRRGLLHGWICTTHLFYCLILIILLLLTQAYRMAIIKTIKQHQIVPFNSLASFHTI